MLFLYLFGALLTAFVVWRWTSVSRGARARDQRIAALLTPLATKLQQGKPVTHEEVETLATRPHVRLMLHNMLTQFERMGLFPVRFADRESHAAGLLTYWMAHPNEYGELPEQLELVETVAHKWGDRSADFVVFKFLMPEQHWARSSGWLLGVVGPYLDEDPYTSNASAFSRSSDKWGEADPAELVRWWAELLASYDAKKPDASSAK